MEKDFDKWNEEKKNVDKRNIDAGLFYNPREIWWCSLGINVGVETDGKHENFERPILVLRKFNKYMFWGIPMTSQESQGDFHQEINYEGGKSWAMLSQIKTISTKRLLRKITTISEFQFNFLRGKLKGLI